MKGSVVIGFILLCSLPAGSLAAMPTTRPVVSVNLQGRDLAGQAHRLVSEKSKASVLLFVGVECPISNGYVPEINRLVKQFSSKAIAFYVVYSGADVTADAAACHAKEFGFTCPALLDPKCELAKAVGATITLEAAVIEPDGSIVYRGRIDDQYAQLGKKRFAA